MRPVAGILSVSALLSAVALLYLGIKHPNDVNDAVKAMKVTGMHAVMKLKMATTSVPQECEKYAEKGRPGALDGCTKCAQVFPGKVDECMDCGHVCIHKTCHPDHDHDHRHGEHEDHEHDGHLHFLHRDRSKSFLECIKGEPFKECHSVCMEMEAKQGKPQESETEEETEQDKPEKAVDTKDCYFDPECHKLVDWEKVGELKMGVFGRLRKIEAVDDAARMAPRVSERLVSFGVPKDRADYIVTKWIKSVFKDYEPAVAGEVMKPGTAQMTERRLKRGTAEEADKNVDKTDMELEKVEQLKMKKMKMMKMMKKSERMMIGCLSKKVLLHHSLCIPSSSSR
jgi:hypothetical protein